MGSDPIGGIIYFRGDSNAMLWKKQKEEKIKKL